MPSPHMRASPHEALRYSSYATHAFMNPHSTTHLRCVCSHAATFSCFCTLDPSLHPSFSLRHQTSETLVRPRLIIAYGASLLHECALDVDDEPVAHVALEDPARDGCMHTGGKTVRRRKEHRSAYKKVRWRRMESSS